MTEKNFEIERSIISESVAQMKACKAGRDAGMALGVETESKTRRKENMKKEISGGP